MWFVIAWWLAVVTVPGLVLIAGQEIGDRVALTGRGVTVLWSGVFVTLALVGAVLLSVAPRYGL